MTRRVLEKLCPEQVCVDFLVPKKSAKKGLPPQTIIQKWVLQTQKILYF